MAVVGDIDLESFDTVLWDEGVKDPDEDREIEVPGRIRREEFGRDTTNSYHFLFIATLFMTNLGAGHPRESFGSKDRSQIGFL